MSSQIKRKFIEDNAVDGSKVRLENNQTLRAKTNPLGPSLGAEQDIFKIDADDELQFQIEPRYDALPASFTQDDQLVNKAYVDEQIAGAGGDISDLQDEVDDTQIGAGLGIDGSYTANGAANYISASTSLKDADDDLDTALKGVDDRVSDIENAIGANNGIAELGPDGKLLSSQIPALTITDVYVVADISARDALTVEEGDVAKVIDAGAGLPRTYIYNGSSWIEIESGSDVDSVNGYTGVVVLDTDDISESLGATNLWFTDSRAQSAAVDNSAYGISWDTVTNVAPSKNAVYEELETLVKLDGSRPMIDDLDMGGNIITDLADPLLAQDAATKAYVDSQAAGAVSDAAYDATWDTVTNVAPSKNAVYDELETLVKLDGSRPMTGFLNLHDATETLVDSFGVISRGNSGSTDYASRLDAFEFVSGTWDFSGGQDGLGVLLSLKSRFSSEALNMVSATGEIQILSGGIGDGFKYLANDGSEATLNTAGAGLKNAGLDIGSYFTPSGPDYYTGMGKGLVIETLEVADGSILGDFSVAAKKAVLGANEGVEFGTVDTNTYVYSEYGSVIKDGADMKVGAIAALKLDAGVGSQIEVLKELDMNSSKIVGLADGTAVSDAATVGQVNAIEIAHSFKKITLTSTDITNGYVDLDHEIVDDSLNAYVDRLAIHKTDDYTLSVVGGVTRLTFTGNLIHPSEEKVEENDVLYVKYAYLVDIQ